MFRGHLKLPQRHSRPPSGPRIALIGCGAIAELLYLPALAKHPSVLEKLILVDPNEERTASLAEKYGLGDRRTDHSSVRNDEIDGVIVTAPNHLHYAISIAFLSNGIPALCEKPLATSTSDAVKMVTVAWESGAPLLVNQTKRLFPTFREVKRLLHAGELGEIDSISYFEGEEYGWPTVSGFYFDRKLTTRGVIQDRGAHALDLICWWLDAKPDVIRSRNDSFGGCEAVARIDLKYGSCEIDLVLSLLGKIRSGYRIVGENATIEGDLYDYRSFEFAYPSGTRTRERLNSRERIFADFADTLVDNFIDVIINDAAPLISGEDVIASIELIDESYACAERFSMPWYETQWSYPGLVDS